jgi:hypothetical protein
MPKIYHYNSAGGYTHASNPRLSPRDLEQGREVLLVPANATLIEPPAPGDNEQVRFIDGSWQIVPVDFITVATSAQLYLPTLRTAILQACPVAAITITPESAAELAEEKTLRINNCPATAENTATVEAIIASHDYGAGVAQRRTAEIISRLSALDFAEIRPLGAITAGTGTDTDRKRLAEIESEKIALRLEIEKFKQ